MKKSLQFLAIVLGIVLSGAMAFGQNTIKGQILDEEGLGLPGASVFIKGSSSGAVTDLDGNFTITTSRSGNQTLVISFVGFDPIEHELVVEANSNIGKVEMSSNSIGLEEVNVIASVAIDRQTPVAVSTLSTRDVEERLGNQEFPQLLKSTPSVYATVQGGGFGDSRINIRGFDQRNTAVLINGIPVNDMENGWVYWSNWAGLSDVTRNMQVQRGLGATKLAISSVGGTINIITKTTDQLRGGVYRSTVGNNGYFKNMLTLSSGKLASGTAITFSGSRTVGDGFVDQTWIDAWSYFGSISQQIGDKQMLVFTAIGAPQRHGQRTFRDRLTTYQNPERGYTFNSDWGMLNGEAYNFRENFYHKPQLALNHYWNISEKAFLATSVYASFGRGGGTGPIGRMEGLRETAFRTADGQFDMQKFYDYNSGTELAFVTDDVNGEDSTYYASAPVVDNERQGGVVRRASMNEHNWYGILSTINLDLSSNISFVGGIDARYYIGKHYRQVDDLMGADFYLDNRDINNPGNKARVGDIIDYNNDGLVNWAGLFAQLEYSNDALSAFATVSGSNTGYKRIDYFVYEESDPARETEWQNFLGYNAKTGVNYKIGASHNVFANVGYFSRAPIFDNVFVNYRNDIADEINNEKVFSLELGYGLRLSNMLSANVNLYNTQWIDRTFQRSFETPSGELYFANIVGLDALHRGLELDLLFTPIQGLEFNGMMSFGNWEWLNNVNASIFDENQNLLGEVNVYADGLKVGDAAQTTYGAGVRYEMPFGLSVFASYNHFDNLYGYFDPTSRTDPESQQALKAPAYGLMDAGLNYNLEFDKFYVGLSANVHNLLDETYIADLNDAASLDVASGWYGLGRTWTAGIKIGF